jgi:hypothetical protein
MIRLKVNGKERAFDGDPDMPCSGICAMCSGDRNQVRLRNGTMRMHGPPQWGHSLLHDFAEGS